MTRLKKTKLGRLSKRDVPPEFHIEVARRLSDYCVALARMTSGNGETFEVFGSGTLVVRNGVHGVLTARHCLRALGRELKLGQLGEDRIYFISKNGKMPSAAQGEVFVRELGKPRRTNPEAGPDLSFIEIPTGPTLSALKAVGSFCPLNRNVDELLATFCVERAYIANLGYPACRYELITRKKGEVRINVTLVAGAGSLRWEDIEHRGAWDYVKCPIDFRAYPHLPKKYDGMSGGGIWTVLFSKEADEFVIRDFALVGVTYFQTGLRRGRCFLRGHFVRSIYQRAWRGSRPTVARNILASG